MATRSTITAKTTDGKFKSIYCHFDGYVSHNGRILLEHYNDQAKIDALVNLGALSSLAASPEKPAGHTFETPIEGYCVAYGRDRGEADTEPSVGDTADEALENGWQPQSLQYLWDGEKWFVNGKPLADEVAAWIK